MNNIVTLSFNIKKIDKRLSELNLCLIIFLHNFIYIFYIYLIFEICADEDRIAFSSGCYRRRFIPLKPKLIHNEFHPKDILHSLG